MGRRLNGEPALEPYFAQLKNYPILNRDRVCELSLRIKSGDSKAKELLINSNLRLVISVARRYTNYGIPFADLVQEGNIGLIRAVDKFDPAKGAFATYAIWWIRQGITRYIADFGRIVRLPVYQVEKLNRIRQTLQALEKKLGREATKQEAADHLNLPIESFGKLILTMNGNHASLEKPVGEGEDSTLGDFIEDPDASRPDAEFEVVELSRVTRNLISGLPKRERVVVEAIFGIDRPEPLNLNDTGVELGITRETVRARRDAALRRLGSPGKAQYLRPFFEG